MDKVSTSINIDSDIKNEAQKLLNDFGMDLSTAINIFYIKWLGTGHSHLRSEKTFRMVLL